MIITMIGTWYAIHIIKRRDKLKSSELPGKLKNRSTDGQTGKMAKPLTRHWEKLNLAFKVPIKRHEEGFEMIISEEKFDHKLLVKKGFVCGQVFTHVKTGKKFRNPYDAANFAGELFKQKLHNHN